MKTLLPTMAILNGLVLCAVGFAADEGKAEAESERQFEPVYETKDSWAFDKQGELVFHNHSANPDRSRYLVWKGYTWIVQDKQITIVDQRPNGTQLKGERGQLKKKDKRLSDKELMNDLKRQASEVRLARSSKCDPQPAIGVHIGIGSDGTEGGCLNVGF